MSRTEKVEKIFSSKYGTSAESIQANALREIAITLAMMYDLMEKNDRYNPNKDDLK